MRLDPGRAFPVKVVEFEPLQHITPGSNGDVEFSMPEEYTGLIAPLIVRSIPDLQPAFDEFASDLKRAAEAS